MFTKIMHKINVVAEFNNDTKSEQLIAKLSDYIYNIIKSDDIIITELQSFPAGYRIKYTIEFYTTKINKQKYTKELSKLSDWLGNDCFGCISKYYYNYYNKPN